MAYQTVNRLRIWWTHSRRQRAGRLGLCAYAGVLAAV